MKPEAARLELLTEWSSSTSDPAINSLLVSIRDAIATATGPSLVGLSLFGSLATGDFNVDVSDIDLIAVLTDGPSEGPAKDLNRMQERGLIRHS